MWGWYLGDCDAVGDGAAALAEEQHHPQGYQAWKYTHKTDPWVGQANISNTKTDWFRFGWDGGGWTKHPGYRRFTHLPGSRNVQPSPIQLRGRYVEYGYHYVSARKWTTKPLPTGYPGLHGHPPQLHIKITIQLPHKSDPNQNYQMLITVHWYQCCDRGYVEARSE